MARHLDAASNGLRPHAAVATPSPDSDSWLLGSCGVVRVAGVWQDTKAIQRKENEMGRGMLIGLLVGLPGGNGAKAADYDPNLCDAFEYNMNPPFNVPAGAPDRLTIDCRSGGCAVPNHHA